MEIQPLIIIGAGRSGTNILRDVLTSLDNMHTWPCDEINYIWRYGNRSYETDELSADLASEKVVSYIRSKFVLMSKRSGDKNGNNRKRYLVEKTCANSLRVSFVDKILPEAKYIFLIRDGRNVVESASKRWKAPLNMRYLIKKARYVPPADLMYYGYRYFINRITKIINGNNQLSVWGPKFCGMRELSSTESLNYVCAEQWVRCVEMSQLAFDGMCEDKYMTVKYEEFVLNPVDTLKKITNFLGSSYEAEELLEACEAVRSDSQGQIMNQNNFDDRVSGVMKATLEKYHYI